MSSLLIGTRYLEFSGLALHLRKAPANSGSHTSLETVVGIFAVRSLEMFLPYIPRSLAVRLNVQIFKFWRQWFWLAEFLVEPKPNFSHGLTDFASGEFYIFRFEKNLIK